MNNGKSVKPFSKPYIELDSAMPSHYALSAILLQNLNILENCEAGIIADINNEYLHSFRITGRRSRSLLNQIRHVYLKSRVSRFRKAFSWLSECTSVHRDLDVFLLALPSYTKKISIDNTDELIPLREHLLSQRYQEHAHLLSMLTSKRYTTFKLRWREFLLQAEKHEPRTENASVPIMETANKAILRNYKKLIRPGQKDFTTIKTYEEIHQLRKDAKKVRYLLESFKTMYPNKDIELVIKVLKKLQDNLGIIVDMEVQKHWLDEWKKELKAYQPVPTKTLMAINKIGVLCNNEKQIAENKFKKRFNQFTVKRNQDLFYSTFS